MITIYLNECGYFITGGDLKIIQRSSPVMKEIAHYLVLIRALQEIIRTKVIDDVVVYNDSRLVEEINGFIEPFNDSNKILVNAIRRQLLPLVRGTVFFRKKAVNAIIAETQDELLLKQKPDIPEKIINKNKRVEKFKKGWFKWKK